MTLFWIGAELRLVRRGLGWFRNPRINNVFYLAKLVKFEFSLELKIHGSLLFSEWSAGMATFVILSHLAWKIDHLRSWSRKTAIGFPEEQIIRHPGGKGWVRVREVSLHCCLECQMFVISCRGREIQVAKFLMDIADIYSWRNAHFTVGKVVQCVLYW